MSGGSKGRRNMVMIEEEEKILNKGGWKIEEKSGLCTRYMGSEKMVLVVVSCIYLLFTGNVN